MKILKVTFLSIIFFFQSAGPVADFCCQILKVPEFIENLNVQAADRGISFLEIVTTHYPGQKDSSAQKNEHHDGESPLQGHHSCTHGIALISPEKFEFISVEFSEAQRMSIFYQPPFSSASLGSIFQPPQV